PSCGTCPVLTVVHVFARFACGLNVDRKVLSTASIGYGWPLGWSPIEKKTSFRPRVCPVPIYGARGRRCDDLQNSKKEFTVFYILQIVEGTPGSLVGPGTWEQCIKRVKEVISQKGPITQEIEGALENDGAY